MIFENSIIDKKINLFLYIQFPVTVAGVDRQNNGLTWMIF